MKKSNWVRGALAAAGVLVPMAAFVPIESSAADAGAPGPAIFVQTNDPAGNAIDTYSRNPDGTLSFAAQYATGGNGSRTVGSTSDPLASQHSLVSAHSLLFAVNAGSDTLSVFSVRGTALILNQVIASGGSFPVSIAVHGNLLYVLNAGGAADVSGFRIVGDHVVPIPGDTRPLGIAELNPPFFLASPAQAGFTPDGRQLIVTTKTNSLVEVFAVESSGALSATPVANPEGGVPFAFLFYPLDQLDLVNAGTGSLAPFAVNADGTITPAGAPVTDGQVAACWIALVAPFAYVANTGSGDVSEFRVGNHGEVTLVNPTAASGISGATDETTSGGGRFLYVQAGLASSVNAYAVAPDGSLTLIQTVAVPDGGSQEGIASS